jgi:hypothetical protein
MLQELGGLNSQATRWIGSTISKGSAYRYAWLASHLVFWYAYVYSAFPNQIHWAYTFGLLALAVALVRASSPLALLFPGRKSNPHGLRELLFLMAVYFGAFYVVSFWELFPGTTVTYGKFELINVVVAISGYVLGRISNQHELLKVHYHLGVVLVAGTLTQLALDPNLLRYGYGAQLMLCLPAAMLLRKYWLVMIGIAVVFSSQHKTYLVSAILALSIVGLFARRTADVRVSSRSPVPYLRAANGILALGLCVVVAILLAPRFVATVARFLPDEASIELLGIRAASEGTDRVRDYASERSLDFLSQHFVGGMGYMNFFVSTGLESNLTNTSRLGREETGVNLHSSYMTWIVEGGLLVVTAVLLLFYRLWKRISWLARNASSRNVGVLAIGWCVALLLLGAYHQLHSTPQFWGTIGIIFGYYDRVVPRCMRPRLQSRQL